MRVVIDPNVMVGACLGSQAAGDILARCLTGDLQPMVGAALFAEYEALLSRDSLFASSHLDARERDELLNIFLASCDWVRIYFLWRPNLPDEADNHIVDLAVAGNAGWIITRNVRDFAGASLRFPEIRIGPPEQVLKEMTP